MLSASEVVQVWKPAATQDAWNVQWIRPLVMSRAQYCLQLESRFGRADRGEPARGEGHLDRVTTTATLRRDLSFVPARRG